MSSWGIFVLGKLKSNLSSRRAGWWNRKNKRKIYAILFLIWYVLGSKFLLHKNLCLIQFFLEMYKNKFVRYWPGLRWGCACCLTPRPLNLNSHQKNSNAYPSSATCYISRVFHEAYCNGSFLIVYQKGVSALLLEICHIVFAYFFMYSWHSIFAWTRLTQIRRTEFDRYMYLLLIQG